MGRPCGKEIGMKPYVYRSGVACFLLLSFCLAPVAHAGINLSWDDCGAFGSISTPLTCTSNSGTLMMIVSVTPSATIPQALGQDSFIQVETSAAAISPWWDLREGVGCRPVSLAASFSFGTLSNCVDAWQGGASGLHQWLNAPFTGVTQANRARLELTSSVPASSPVQLTAGTEYYFAEAIINKQKTTGLGSCAGCTD